MPNSRFNSQVGQVKKTSATYQNQKPGTSPGMTMKGPDWPGLPGKAGPDRDGGFGKTVKTQAQSKGIQGG